MDDILKSIRDGVLAQQIWVEKSIQPTVSEDDDVIEKGGKPAFIGEVRTFNGKKYKKVVGGWRLVPKKDLKEPVVEAPKAEEKKLERGSVIDVAGDRGSGNYTVTIQKRETAIEKREEELTGIREEIYSVLDKDGKTLFITRSDKSKKFEIDIYLEPIKVEEKKKLSQLEDYKAQLAIQEKTLALLNRDTKSTKSRGEANQRVLANIAELKSRIAKLTPKEDYKITQGMIEYLDKHPAGSLKEHIVNYSKEAGISFSDAEVTSLIDQYEKSPKPEGSALEVGFTDSQFEKFVYANEKDIKDNMKRYSVGRYSLTNIGNPYDFASVLGVDSKVVKKIDLEYYTKILQSLLFSK